MPTLVSGVPLPHVRHLDRCPECPFHASQTHESDVIGDLVRGLLSRGAGAGGRSVSDWLHAPALRDDAAPQAVLVFISKQVSILP